MLASGGRMANDNVSRTISVLVISSVSSDDEGRDGPRNVALPVIQPPDAAASPRMFY
jgi:hypothetical protein